LDERPTRVEPATVPPEAALVRRVEEGVPRVIDHRARSRMAAMLAFPIPPVRVVEGPAADELVRRQGADALSFGETVVMRHGMFRTDRPEGLALLAHELTHADARRRDGGRAADASPAAARAEEVAARANEARVYRGLTTPRGTVSTQAGAPVVVLPASPTPVAGLRAADSDRPREPAPEAQPVAAATSVSTAQMKAIKDEVYRDLLARIRTEFERGG
jgi:hypothetical protein